MDILIVSSLILLIPGFVKKYLARCGIAREIRIAIVICGIIWILLSCRYEFVCSIVGVKNLDAKTYSREGKEMAASLRPDNLVYFLKKCHKWQEKSFYIGYQALLYYLTGATFVAANAINAFLSFWGGLVLTKLISSFHNYKFSEKSIFPFIIIFVPSVVFWGSANLKEAFIYWSICQVYGFIGLSKTRLESLFSFVLFFIGAYIGLHIRPHIMIVWLFGVLAVKIFQRGFWKYGLILLFLSPMLISNATYRINFKSYEANVVEAERRMKTLIQRKRNSTFDYGERGPIPLISGLINTHFRPVIWRISNFRSLLSALEIWAISISLFFFWFNMKSRDWKAILSNYAIRVAFLVITPFWWLFTYFPNEGLLARQRIQVFPALLVLLVTPVLVRKSGLKELHSEIEVNEKFSGSKRTEGSV